MLCKRRTSFWDGETGNGLLLYTSFTNYVWWNLEAHCMKSLNCSLVCSHSFSTLINEILIVNSFSRSSF